MLGDKEGIQSSCEDSQCHLGASHDACLPGTLRDVGTSRAMLEAGTKQWGDMGEHDQMEPREQVAVVQSQDNKGLNKPLGDS